MTAVLVRHLVIPHQAETRATIADVLAHAAPVDRQDVQPALLRALAIEQDEAVRERILFVISNNAGSDDLGDLVKLVNDRNVGDARLHLLAAFARFGDDGRAALVAASADAFLRDEATRQIALLERSHARPQRASAPAGSELASVAVDRDQLPMLLEGLQEAPGLPVEESLAAIARLAELQDGADLPALTLTGTGGRWITVQVFLDDVDALDVHVLGPEALRSTVERVIEDLPLDR